MIFKKMKLLFDVMEVSYDLYCVVGKSEKLMKA